MSKFLVTSGCSFSTVFNHDHDLIQGGTWPHVLRLLTPTYQWQPVALGLEGQGNGLISRKLIQSLINLLYEQQINPNDILVGVMWSGPDRLEKHDDTEWQIVPPQSHPYKIYHKYIANPIATTVITIEHILRVQWFLERVGVKYFMTTYTSEVLNKKYIDHNDVKYLYKQIDFDKFLPIEGMYEWCRNYSSISFPMTYPGDNHPGFKQHKEFTEKIILPFCINNGLLEL